MIFLESTPALVALGCSMNMEIVEALGLYRVGMSVRFAVISAQTENRIESWHFVAKNRRKIQGVDQVLSSVEHERTPFRASDLERPLLMLISFDELFR